MAITYLSFGHAQAGDERGWPLYDGGGSVVTSPAPRSTYEKYYIALSNTGASSPDIGRLTLDSFTANASDYYHAVWQGNFGSDLDPSVSNAAFFASGTTESTLDNWRLTWN